MEDFDKLKWIHQKTKVQSTGFENNIGFIRNRNLSNTAPLPPITQTQETKENIPKTATKISKSSKQRSLRNQAVLPPIILTNKESQEFCKKMPNSTLSGQVTRSITKTSTIPLVSVHGVFPNMDMIKPESITAYLEYAASSESEEIKKQEEEQQKRTIEKVRTEHIRTYLASKNSKRRGAICEVLDYQEPMGLAEYYRNMTLNSLFYIYPDSKQEKPVFDDINI